MNSIISLGIYQNSGGPTKTIGYFQRALDAKVYAFCKAKEIMKYPLAVEHSCPVRSFDLPILSQFCVPPKEECHEAELALAKSNILSVHSFYRYHALWVNRMSNRYGVPYWFVPHGILDPWVMKKAAFAKKIFWEAGGRKFLDQASTVICSTTRERDKAMRQFELPAADVIHWPVKVPDCSEREARRNELRRHLGVPDSARVLLYFGRLHSMKRPLETIRAVAAVRSERLHLVIVGNDQDVTLKDCYNLAVKLGVERRVHLVGPVYGKAKYDYMFASDGYISMSNRENFNHTAAESMSAGLPLILSPGNDLFSDIEPVNCAWGLVDDQIVTATRVIECFANKSQVELLEMGRRGSHWVMSNLSFSTFQTRLQRVVEKYSK